MTTEQTYERMRKLVDDAAALSFGKPMPRTSELLNTPFGNELDALVEQAAENGRRVRAGTHA